MKRFTAILGLVIPTIFLLNFTFGIFEIPDYLPVIGNLDEVAASIWLMASLKHFGIDITDFLLSSKTKKNYGSSSKFSAKTFNDK